MIAERGNPTDESQRVLGERRGRQQHDVSYLLFVVGCGWGDSQLAKGQRDGSVHKGACH